MPEFVHLHCHTQFSLLDGASEIGAMMDKAKADGQKGVALTDHGNMYGAFKFVAEANKRDLKPLVGCEFYLVEDRHKKQFLKSNGEKDKRYHQLLLAKDQAGYQNLAKLCSLGFIEGLYSKFPRIDKELLEQYSEGLIATSCCIGAELPQTILRGDEEKAEEHLKWWLNLFGDDYYIELQRHRGLENIDNTGISQEYINQVLIKLARKHDVKVIATNDSHYIEEEDWKPHDILLCVNTASKVNEMARFKFPSTDFYFKTQDQMSALFSDIPEAIANTIEIYDKITPPKLKRDILLPNFPMPPGFNSQPEYLRHLVYEGAKIRYHEISEVVRERLDLELSIIKNMGFDGYFLIVQDFIRAAREMGVSVGPGRGSAAGSAVAFCLTITNIDPIKYNLLFERFLNPERISMPDIDIDFDDYGRQQVIDWVVDKYGKNQVAQIITFGTMAAKSSIRDVARVLDLPLADADRMSKMVPNKPGTKLNKLFKPIKEIQGDWQGDDLSNIKTLQEIEKRDSLDGETLKLAKKLEGSVRNTGIHAAGVIIAPDDITKYIPVCTSKDAELLVTQFDGSVVEDAGMLKMDFLGLRTLSIIKDAVVNIAERYGTAPIDIDEIDLEDEVTFELFQKGEMIGVFQFESDGMRRYLKELKPTSIEDLIAMNALYRPGPMDYIPSFINRKHGLEEVEYPHPWLKELLEPTYGIMVYQEQIMRCAQIMADYSLGKADILRRAMGKKKKSEMDKQSKIFVEGAKAKGVPEEQAKSIFSVMEKFASYGFNRSHAAAYSVLAYQTGWLKAHHPAEFMASVLTHNKNDISKLNFFLRECKRMGLLVLPPNVNESGHNFTVNQEGNIRFGLSALKNMGEGPVTAILEERKENGHFDSIFDMTKRLNLRAVNKKCLESLVLGGGLDTFGKEIHRAQYFQASERFETTIEHALKYGHAVQNQENQNQNSLFGDISDVGITVPKMPEAEKWSLIFELTKEKEVTGIYISGHPLDDYKLEIENFTNCSLDIVENYKDRLLKIAGIVTTVQHRTSKKGTGYGIFTIQDFRGSLELRMFSEDYKKYKALFEVGEALYLEGMYQLGWNGNDYNFNLKSVRLLDAVGEEMTNSVTIQVPVHKVNAEMISKIDEVIMEHPGSHKFKMQIFDRDDDILLNLISKSKRVKADNLFIKELLKLGVKYKLN